MANMTEEKQCFQFLCPNFPKCKWTRAGRCCAIEADPYITEIDEKMCNKENDYACFEADERVKQ